MGRYQVEHDNFDQLYGTDTTGPLIPSEVNITGEHAKQASAYTPISTADFRRMIEDTGLSHEALAHYTFVDVGSGKGRAILLAALYPFNTVIGVELSAVLHLVAEKNAVIFREHAPACPSIELHCEDATTFQFPDDPLVIFFFAPFGEVIMSRVMANIGQTLRHVSRPIYLVYNRGINLKPYAPEIMEMGGLFHRIVERLPEAWKGQTGWYVYRHLPTGP
jgi:SAM-dependent methyltransferase